MKYRTSFQPPLEHRCSVVSQLLIDLIHGCLKNIIQGLHHRVPPNTPYHHVSVPFHWFRHHAGLS